MASNGSLRGHLTLLEARMLIERRRLARTSVAQPAKLLVDDAGVMHDCIVDNLNTLGACIDFNSTPLVTLPSRFDVTFDDCQTYWHCDVIWQNPDVRRTGVIWQRF
jgi:hypothetical protein